MGNRDRRPTRDFGLDAAREASDAPAESGSVGAGTGATVAKALGADHSLKGGVGTASRLLPDGHRIGAVMAVNAFGDIVDPETGAIIAGPRSDNANEAPSKAPARYSAPDAGAEPAALHSSPPTRLSASWRPMRL